MRKIIAFLLLAVMAFGICSCAQTTEEEFLLDLNGMNGDSSTIDLDGYECSIMQADLVEGDGGLFSYPDSTLMADMILERFDEI